MMVPPGMCTRIDKRRAHVYGRGDDKLVATNIRCDCNAILGRTSPNDPKFNPVVCELGDVADVSDDEDGPGAAGELGSLRSHPQPRCSYRKQQPEKEPFDRLRPRLQQRLRWIKRDIADLTSQRHKDPSRLRAEDIRTRGRKRVRDKLKQASLRRFRGATALT